MKYSDLGLLILRLGVGAGFVFVHGLGKITGGTEVWTKLGSAMTHLGITFAPVIWGFAAALTEFAGGILLAFGLFTRTVSSLMAFTMFVAAVMHLAKLDPWNKVIYPLELLSVFIALIFLGAGKYSLDRIIFKK